MDSEKKAHILFLKRYSEKAEILTQAVVYVPFVLLAVCSALHTVALSFTSLLKICQSP
jgi:hypothetical protein